MQKRNKVSYVKRDFLQHICVGLPGQRYLGRSQYFIEKYYPFEGIKLKKNREAVISEQSYYRIACENSGHSVVGDFPEVRKIVEAGATSKPKKDYELSRYACYLIVQNGDPRKEVVALGQTYFAIQTYRQELVDYFNKLDEDRRSLYENPQLKIYKKSFLI